MLLQYKNPNNNIRLEVKGKLTGPQKDLVKLMGIILSSTLALSDGLISIVIIFLHDTSEKIAEVLAYYRLLNDDQLAVQVPQDVRKDLASSIKNFIQAHLPKNL